MTRPKYRWIRHDLIYRVLRDPSIYLKTSLPMVPVKITTGLKPSLALKTLTLEDRFKNVYGVDEKGNLIKEEFINALV